MNAQPTQGDGDIAEGKRERKYAPLTHDVLRCVGGKEVELGVEKRTVASLQKPISP